MVQLGHGTRIVPRPRRADEFLSRLCEADGRLPALLSSLRDGPGAARQPDGDGAPTRSKDSTTRSEGARNGRSLRSRHGTRRALPDRGPARPGRNGRGLSRRRPEARAGGRPQISAPRPRRRRGPARAALRRGAHGAARVAPLGLPRVGYRRGGRAALPLDGVRGRREPRVAAAAHRPLPPRQGDRRQPPDRRGVGGRAREGPAAPRSEARQRDARRPGPGAPHRLRARGARRLALGRGRALGHAVLHVARAARRARGERPQ